MLRLYCHWELAFFRSVIQRLSVGAAARHDSSRTVWDGKAVCLLEGIIEVLIFRAVFSLICFSSVGFFETGFGVRIDDILPLSGFSVGIEDVFPLSL
jgi:hypothetical protein